MKGESFMTSKNWLTLGEAVSPESARSPEIKASEIQGNTVPKV